VEPATVGADVERRGRVRDLDLRPVLRESRLSDHILDLAAHRNARRGAVSEPGR
jgi:hypothetical protein